MNPWIKELKNMKWWMFLPFGILHRKAGIWVFDGVDFNERIIRHTLLLLVGMFTTVPLCLWLIL